MILFKHYVILFYHDLYAVLGGLFSFISSVFVDFLFPIMLQILVFSAFLFLLLFLYGAVHDENIFMSLIKVIISVFIIFSVPFYVDYLLKVIRKVSDNLGK